MAESAKFIEISILGRNYKIACEEGERAALMEAVAFLDAKMGEIKKAGKVSGTDRIAVMAAREGLQFETTLESDTAPLASPVLALIASDIDIHCLRDLTRGGLASALNEIAEAAGASIEIEERRVPIRDDVRGACELLGFDPLYVANEGRFVAFVPEHDADRAVDVLKAHALGASATIIGRVDHAGDPTVVVWSPINTRRVLDMLSGEQLPRIC